MLFKSPYSQIAGNVLFLGLFSISYDIRISHVLRISYVIAVRLLMHIVFVTLS